MLMIIYASKEHSLIQNIQELFLDEKLTSCSHVYVNQHDTNISFFNVTISVFLTLSLVDEDISLTCNK